MQPDLRAQAWGAMREQAARNADIRARAAKGESTRDLAAEFGITRRRVDQIIASRAAPRTVRRCPTCGQFHAARTA